MTVEDLESRNGVIVNGQRITTRTSVKPGDKIVIGSQELVLREGRRACELARDGRRRRSSERSRQMAVPPEIEVERQMLRVGRPQGLVAASAATHDEPSIVRRADAFNLLGGVAEKALAMGRAEEAERLLAAPLADVIEASRAGKRLSHVARRAWRRALRRSLRRPPARGAGSTTSSSSTRRRGGPCPAPVVDELYTALRKVNAVDLVRLRGYLAALREKQASLGPAERFLVQRIEGLERLAALR